MKILEWKDDKIYPFISYTNLLFWFRDFAQIMIDMGKDFRKLYQNRLWIQWLLFQNTVHVCEK